MKKVLGSWESPFANCLLGAPGGDYLSRAIVNCRGAPTMDTAFMGLTSCRKITISRKLPRSRRGAPRVSCPAASTTVPLLQERIQGRVLDLLREPRHGLRGRLITEHRTMGLCPYRELPHSAPAGQLGKLLHEL